MFSATPFRFYFTLALLMLGSAVRAQTFHFRSFSADAGLPFVQVFTIHQDEKGYLWTGGYGGLSRYDGRRFLNYSPRNGLANHFVSCVTSDGEGKLWIGTIKGLNVFDGKSFRLYNSKNGLPDDNVNQVIMDQHKMIWVGTNRGLVSWNGKTFKTYGRSEGLETEKITALYEDREAASIWIGTTKGAYLFDGKKMAYFPVSAVLSNAVTAIAKDKSGTILLGTADGVYKKDSRGFTLILTPSGINMPAVNALLTDRKGITWIGAGDGLYAYDGTTFTYYKPSRDENGRNVRSLFEDYEGNLWLGTFSGLYRFRGPGFSAYGVHDGLFNTFIYGIYRDRKNLLWVGTSSGGAYTYDGAQFKQYARREGLPADQVNCFLEDENGGLWIGGVGALAYYNGSAFTTYTTANGLANDSVNCLLRDKKGRIWIGSNHVLSVFENNRFTHYNLPPSRQSVGIFCLAEDSDGSICVGTYLGGIFRFSNGQFTLINDNKAKKTDSYLAMVKDNAGRILFGTLDGVYVYENGKITDHIGEEDGLSSNLVYSLMMSRNNKQLWVGTNQGINRISWDKYIRTGEKEIQNFGKEEGFSGVECNGGGFYEDADGTCWFGTVNGLIRFDPQQWNSDTAMARTSITNIRLFYKDTLFENNSRLPWDENNLSFEYIGISLANPAKVRYQYMLEGYEKNWSLPSDNNITTYSNLPPGKYTFRVKTCNSEGRWSEMPATFAFEIRTPFWRQLWFWLVLLSASVALLFIIIRVRIANIRKRERHEAQIRVEVAMNQLKALRAQMNPHFVFNSMNSIQHFIINNNTQEAGKYLNKFARLIRLILYNSEKANITIREEVDLMRLYLELESLRFEGKFTYEMNIAPDVDIDYFEIPSMLLQPYVENAILHGLMPLNGGGRLLFDIRLQGEMLICTIEDNGIGRKKARELRQLSLKKDHTSMGMRITQDRLEIINRLHSSNLTLNITDLENEKGEATGTRVEVFIPLG